MYLNRFLQERQVKLVLYTCVKRYVHSDQEKMRSDCFERYDNFQTVRKSANWWSAVKGDAIQMQRAYFRNVIQVIFLR